MANFISISGNTVINPEHITLMTTDSEQGELDVYLANGTHLTFEEDTAGQFLWNFDESCFEDSPKLKQIRDNYEPYPFTLEPKPRLGEDDQEIKVLDQVINNSQILGLTLEDLLENHSLKIIMGDFNTFRINHPEVIWEFLNNFNPDSLPRTVKTYYNALAREFESLEDDFAPY